MWISPKDMRDILDLFVCKECGGPVAWNRKYKCWEHEFPDKAPASTCLDELNNRRLDMVVKPREEKNDAQ